MAKFTIEEKMEAVKRYLEGDEVCRTIAKEIGVHKSKVQFLVRKYEYHGEKAFFKSYTNYPLNFKLDVLNYINDNGTSIFETAAIFGKFLWYPDTLSKSLLNIWITITTNELRQN